MSINPHIHSIVTCAGPNCGKQKGAVNRWWIILPARAAGRDPADVNDGLLLVPFNASLLSSADAMPVCGIECVHKIMSQHMSKVLAEEATCASVSSTASISR